MFSDGEGSGKGSVVGELIADIFGSSDEEGEFEGFKADDVEKSKKGKTNPLLTLAEMRSVAFFRCAGSA